MSKSCLIILLIYASLACAGLPDQVSTASVQANEHTSIERLQFQRLPQANLYDPDFTPMVLRYSKNRESLTLDKLQTIANAAFADENYAKARRYYMRLAPYGDKNAQLRIGFIHLQGLGDVKQDVPRGMAWLELARETPITNPVIADEIDAIWQQLDQQQRQQAQVWLDKLAPMYSNLALLSSLDHYYERYFLNRGGTNLKSAGDRTSAAGTLLLDSQPGVDIKRADGGFIGNPNQEFGMRREFQYVTRMLEESAGTAELGELELLDDAAEDASKSSDEDQKDDNDE